MILFNSSYSWDYTINGIKCISKFYFNGGNTLIYLELHSIFIPVFPALWHEYHPYFSTKAVTIILQQ